MRIFSIEKDGKFKEFTHIPFHINYEEVILEKWLENNPNEILENSKLLIIGRQTTTNLGSIIDLLGIDRQGNIVVLELKRDRTPRETLAQALEYASFIEELDTEQLEKILQHYLNDESLNLAEFHRDYFELKSDEAISFKNQRIVIIGQNITSEVRQTATFLRMKGIQVTCLEFSFFQADDQKNLLSYNIVVGKEPKKIREIFSGSLPIVTKEAFLESLDENGRDFFQKILHYSDENALLIRWGTKGFSMNVDKEGIHVPICYGYPPAAVFKQAMYTALFGRGGFSSKLEVSETVTQELWQEAQHTGLFQSAGHELKVLVNRKFTEGEISSVIDWFDKLIRTIKTHELK